MSPSELLELAVSPEGLDREGRREIEVGDHVAVLAVDGDDAPLTWRAPDGRVTARPPVAIADRTAEIARAKEALKELRKAIGIERGRIEDLFTEDREWPLRRVAHALPRAPAHPHDRRPADLDGGRRRRTNAGPPGRRRLQDVTGAAVTPSATRGSGPGTRSTPTTTEVAAWRTCPPRAPAPAAVQAGVPRGLPPDAGRGADRHLLEPVRRPHPALLRRPAR